MVVPLQTVVVIAGRFLATALQGVLVAAVDYSRIGAAPRLVRNSLLATLKTWGMEPAADVVVAEAGGSDVGAGAVTAEAAANPDDHAAVVAAADAAVVAASAAAQWVVEVVLRWEALAVSASCMP